MKVLGSIALGFFCLAAAFSAALAKVVHGSRSALTYHQAPHTASFLEKTPLSSHYDRSTNAIVIDADPSDPACSYVLDIMHVQDISNSFEDDLVSLVTQVSELYDLMEGYWPGSRLGLSAFVDIPHEQVAYDNVPCFTSLCPLGATKGDLIETLKKTTAWGGDDLSEDQLGAMVRAALAKSSNWAEEDFDEETGKPRVRVVLMATDAATHFTPGYGKEYVFAKHYDSLCVQQNCTCCTKTESFADLIASQESLDDGNAYCADTDYASFEDWGKVFTEKRIIPIILTGNWTYVPEGHENDTQLYFDQEVVELSKKLNKPAWDNVYTGLEAFWTDALGFAGLDGVVTTIDSSSSNFAAQVIEQLVNHLPKLICRAGGTKEVPDATTTTKTATMTTAATRAPATTARATTTPTKVTATTTVTTTVTTTAAAKGGTTTTAHDSGNGHSKTAVMGGVAGGAGAAAVAGAAFYARRKWW